MNSELQQVRFDTALPTLVRYVRDVMKIDPSHDGVFLRDGFGRVAFYSAKKIPTKSLNSHRDAAGQLLGAISFSGGAIQDSSSIGASILKDSLASVHWINVDGNLVEIRLVDRRFFGRDWLNTPSSAIKGMPPLMVFGSLKGGVGRTTALFVLSMDLARSGKNVLVVDLDLEAPGLASLLFGAEERPLYGVLDYLVENGLGGVSDEQLTEFVGTSRLTDRDEGRGRVDLAPATGSVTVENPENMLGKLARGLVEDPSDSGPPKSLAGQIRELVTRLATRSSYDAVLVDARAGLSELTAGPLLGLGGIVALFGADQPQTFEGYRYLMAHLATLPVPNIDDDWRERVRFVHSMAPADSKSRDEFDDKLYELLSETFYESDVQEDVFNFSFDEEAAPHKAWRVYFDRQFFQANPISDRSLLQQEIYRAAFGSFLDSAKSALGFDLKKLEN